MSDLFVIESPSNWGTPGYSRPPPGWFAIRSSTKRLFMQLDRGAMPHPDEIQRRLAAGEGREAQWWENRPECGTNGIWASNAVREGDQGSPKDEPSPSAPTV